MGGQLTKGFVEIGLRCRCDAIAVLTKVNLVEIKLQDLLLAQRFLDPGGKDDLLDLARKLAVTRQKEVLHHLLGDGRCTAHRAPARA